MLPESTKARVEDLLTKHAVLSRLDPNEQEALLAGARVLQCTMGEDMVREGENADEAYLITNGKARVWKTGPTGAPVTVAQLSKGDLFGEFAVLTGAARSASVRASEAIEMVAIAGQDLRELCGRRPEIRADFERFMRQADRANFLRVSTIFSHVPVRQLLDLLDKMETREYPAGIPIIRQGESADAFFLVYRGEAKVVVRRDFQDVELAYLGPGSHFGEKGLLEANPRSASVLAHGECVCLCLLREPFLQLLEVAPALRSKLYKHVENYQINEEVVEKFGVQPRWADGGPKVSADDSGITQGLPQILPGNQISLLPPIAAPEPAPVVPADPSPTASPPPPPAKPKSLPPGTLQPPTAPPLATQPASLPPGTSKPPPPEAAMVSRVKPRKPRFFQRYPWIRQHEETDCGAACLAMVGRYHGTRLAVGRLRSLAQVGREGTTLLNLAAAAERIGFSTRALQTDYAHLRETTLPAIAHWKGYHYIVVYEATTQHAIVGDPAEGLLKIPRATFESHWTGRLLQLTPSDHLEQHHDALSPIARFLPLLTPHRKVLLEVLLASLLLQVLQLAAPLFTQAIVDKVLVHQNAQLLDIMLIGMVLVAAFQMTTMLLRRYLLLHVSQQLGLKMSADLFRQMLKLPMRFFQTRHIGDMIERFNDNRTIQRLLTGTALTTALDILSLLTALALMFCYSVELTLVVLFFLPLYIGLTLFFTPLFKRNNQTQFDKASNANAILVESVGAIETIKNCTAELSTRWRFEELAVQHANARFGGGKLEMSLEFFSGSVRILANTILLWYGAHLVIQGKLTVGELMAFQSLVLLVSTPIMGMIQLWDQFQQVLLSLERINDIFAAEQEQLAGSHGILLPRIRGQIKLAGVSFRYNPEDRDILKNINLEIRPGETVALVGRSGSGKSTLVRLLERFYQPTEGKVFFDGFDIATVDVRTLRRQIGVVSADSTIFSGSIRANISTADTEASMERIIAAAKLANAHDFIMGFPMGYETRVGEAGLRLSSGQKQRLCIARALLSEPRVLIFDEATSMLDTESEKVIQENMRVILKDRTAIIIAHRLSTIRDANTILVMDDGMIVERGNHRELLDRKGLYYYLCTQQLGM